MSAETASNLKFEIGHVLFIDIVGYSKLLINEQSEQIQKLKEIVRGTEQVRLAEAEGKLLRLPTGDGGALVFRTSPEAPVLCALEISKELKNHPELRVRMGIHSGPVNEVVDLNEQSNIAGAGINIAQRVMDCGDAGHILLSRRVAEDLEHYPRWRPHLHRLGEIEVKHGDRISVVNFYQDELGNPATPQKFRSAEAIAAAGLPTQRSGICLRRWIIGGLIGTAAVFLALGLIKHQRKSAVTRRQDASAARTEAATGSTISQKSIAVLPFVDLSQAKDQEYFCDGISEEILDTLAKIEGLRVVARTSSFSFKGKNADVGEIAQKLNVQNILEGSLRREGNRIRITAQLVNAANGFHLWSETYERELQGVFAVQDEITRAIVDALKIKLAVAATSGARQDSEAHDLYLQGLYFSNKSGEEDLRKSLDFFQRALQKDPNYAKAWTGIAKAWEWLADVYVKPLEAYPAMRTAAANAIAIDEKEAEAHVYLGDSQRVLNWDVAGGEAELKRALQLDPNCGIAHLFLALSLASEGDAEGAQVHIREAVKLDPLSPIISTFAGFIDIAYGRLDDAIAEGRRTQLLDPNYLYQGSQLAVAYREKGMFAEALELFKKAAELTGIPQPGLAVTYAKMGRRSDAERVLGEVKTFAATHYFAGEEVASIYVALGDNDAAFQWLERAYNEHSGSLHGIVARPIFRPLRSDPRFADLLRRIGVDPAKVLVSPNKP
jgi:adenylate cyclase